MNDVVKDLKCMCSKGILESKKLSQWNFAVEVELPDILKIYNPPGYVGDRGAAHTNDFFFFLWNRFSLSGTSTHKNSNNLTNCYFERLYRLKCLHNVLLSVRGDWFSMNFIVVGKKKTCFLVQSIFQQLFDFLCYGQCLTLSYRMGPVGPTLFNTLHITEIK